MRLDAQVKMAERKKTPYWLYATVAVLVVGLGVGGYVLLEKKKENEKIAAENVAKDSELALEKKAREEAEARAKELEEEAETLAAKQADLAKQLAGATSDAEAAKIRAEQEKLKEEQESITKKISANKKRTGGTTTENKPAVKERTDKIKLGGGDSPLGGL